MALAADTIANSIAALVVTGIDILDLDEIPDEVTARDCPLLYPRPDNWLTNLRVERMSVGPGTTAAFNVRYTLNYVYLHSPITQGRSVFEVYKAMVNNVLLILDALIANDAVTGSIDLTPQGVPAFSPVADPTGNVFHGCIVSIDVMEFVN